MGKFIGVLLFLSSVVAAETDIRGAKDTELLERFPRSYIIQYEASEGFDYRLVLGGLEKINGVLAPEKEQRLNGRLTRITYRIPKPHTPNEAFSFMSRQLENSGFAELFHCQGRDCGSSNQWANNILNYSRLYGVEDSQQFSSFRLGNHYISLYSVRRGNKRVYLRVDVLESSELALMDALNQGVQKGLQGSDDELGTIVKFLGSHAEKRVWILTRDAAAGSKLKQLDRARETGESIKRRLIGLGAAENQIILHPLGGFCMVGRDDSDSSIQITVISEEN